MAPARHPPLIVQCNEYGAIGVAQKTDGRGRDKMTAPVQVMNAGDRRRGRFRHVKTEGIGRKNCRTETGPVLRNQKMTRGVSPKRLKPFEPLRQFASALCQPDAKRIAGLLVTTEKKGLDAGRPKGGVQPERRLCGAAMIIRRVIGCNNH